ncbi:sensor histidine kinase [Sporosarcina sp. PTS2304]|uniref:sensor histidine kinase n=1 Tax=Sporosarcina sp. PTS2304 TaxID=2283194 RepID=UPI000E0D147D|nr:sensor histidine kinase [Sporosarcina sp. PTS2304]AXH98400.1 sensor histidine kinase [Sporosarcina sp. PTS2304]
MKAFLLFFREHIPFMLFQLGLILFILLLYWLDGFRSPNTAIYSVAMGVLLTAGYLTGKFIMRRSFYASIVEKPKKMEDALIRHVLTPEHRQTTEFTRELYRLYQHEVQTLYNVQHRHLHFMNQWVHQMKTPISVVNLLLQEEEVDKKSISQEVERIQTGLEIVLVNARLETFEDDMQIERLSLKMVLQEVFNENKRLFIAKGLFPVLTVDEHLMVATDRKWIKFMLNQFITNAVKYTFEKGKKIYVVAEPTADGLQLEIKDEGIGIPASDLHRVTKAFFTGENGRLSGESTGMGLYIASEVCKRLGHELTILSKQGEGTTIRLVFTGGEAGEASDEKTNR